MRILLLTFVVAITLDSMAVVVIGLAIYFILTILEIAAEETEREKAKGRLQNPDEEAIFYVAMLIFATSLMAFLAWLFFFSWR